MQNWQRILVFTKVDHTARREVVHGIGRYAHERSGWQPMIPWADLDHWSLPEGMKIDGVIAFPQSAWEIDFLLGLKCPVVCTGPHYSAAALPRVEWDDELAGRLAVEHLAGSGLKRIAFLGANLQTSYVAKRLEGARHEAAQRGIGFEMLDLEPDGHQPGKEALVSKRAAAWLKDRESPFGIVAATDLTGLDALSALQSADITVPEQAAVISIGGDNLLCPFSEPTLSSVVLPGLEVGYRAAETLDRMMQGDKALKREKIMVAPRRLAVRRSSDVIATGDEMVRQALTYIREHACEPIRVCDVLGAVPLSRRPLELRFKQATGRTLQKEIWRVRLQRAKELLIETDLPVADIADCCGFSAPQRMTEVFVRELGIAPGAFRQSCRMTGRRG